MQTYSAYGLVIESSIPLPQLAPGDGPADVRVRTGSVPREGLEQTPNRRQRVTRDTIVLEYAEAVALELRNGEEIVVDPFPGVDPRLVSQSAAAVGLGTLLHQRGRLVLHASCLLAGDGAVAFLGGSGYGKSTMAGALMARGRTLISDDLAPVEMHGATPTIRGGGVQMKLWPDAAAALGEDTAALPVLTRSDDKRGRPFSPLGEDPLALRRLYVLGVGPAIEVVPLAPGEAVGELIRHSYCAALMAGDAALPHLRQCSRVADAVEVRRLRRPASLDALPRVAEAVERDLADLELTPAPAVEAR